MDRCSLYGKVLEIKIPRPIWQDRTDQNQIDDAAEEERVQQEEEEEKKKHEENNPDQPLPASSRKDKNKKDSTLDPLDDPRNYNFPFGFCSAFIEYTSVMEARRARRNMHLLKFNNRTVECEFHDERNFEENNFMRLEPEKLEIRGFEFEGLENCAIEFTEPRQSEPMRL